jgi:hypothetical protein
MIENKVAFCRKVAARESCLTIKVKTNGLRRAITAASVVASIHTGLDCAALKRGVTQSLCLSLGSFDINIACGHIGYIE